ncbi:hypothetical protein Q4E93_14175 [Flavitalea sp. BT771]|uniref:hypothetical protein n=1 Tax=Flavitalea sp. BT771 TaxID=3063329 RepID=UPI0026E3CE2D|nr:hypothetical protein [Flavitalea sp. BT771]MDO6431747.1 hypothetical protein [Flavitalea sp. BT771]MDV6220655.1 hypothetical protein [Flavitalea sp. BT771]
MKIRTVLTFACTFAALVSTGCKKNNNTNHANINSISATLNGVNWQSQYTAGIAPTSNSFIFLYGYFVNPGDTSVIELDIPDSIQVNDPDPFYGSTASYTKSDGTFYLVDNFFGGHGTITVTLKDTNIHRIAGTFSGVFYNTENGKDSIQIGNGRFNTSYFAE